MKMPSKNKVANNIGEQSEITSEILLLVEGKDEVNFFDQLFKIMNLQKSIQIISIDGVQNLKIKIKTIKNMPNFEIVKSIGIIRDNDGSTDSAMQSISNMLNELSLPSPTNHNTFAEKNGLQVSVFIMPGPEISGTMLEDLCLETQKDNANISLIEKYLADLKNNGTSYPNNESKAKCLIYLASNARVVNGIGLGALKGYWNLEHECLIPIKDFIENL